MTLHISTDEVERAVREWIERKGFQSTGALKAKYDGPYPDDRSFHGYEIALPEEEES